MKIVTLIIVKYRSALFFRVTLFGLTLFIPYVMMHPFSWQHGAVRSATVDFVRLLR
jgi:hypothetical protein